MDNESRLTRKEEDELLKFAHVPIDTQKFYAIQYRGYPDELPFVFLQNAVGARDIRGFAKEITFKVGLLRTTQCQKGDWIVIRPDGETEVLEDQEFRTTYMRLTDMSFQSHNSNRR